MEYFVSSLLPDAVVHLQNFQLAMASYQNIVDSARIPNYEGVNIEDDFSLSDFGICTVLGMSTTQRIGNTSV